MDNFSSLKIIDRQKAAAAKELRECNDITLPFGLYLSEKNIQSLVEKRFAALKDTGRIEFGQSILKKLIRGFCDSPYIDQNNYQDTVLQLIDIFYYFKNESLELITDEELIGLMRKYFDGVCQGSLDYLAGSVLEDICRGSRYGCRIDG